MHQTNWTVTNRAFANARNAQALCDETRDTVSDARALLAARAMSRALGDVAGRLTDAADACRCAALVSPSFAPTLDRAARLARSAARDCARRAWGIVA